MNSQYRKNLKDVATACKNYTDKRFDDFKWELGTHTIDTATDSDVAYQKQAPNGTIGCQINSVGGMSYKSEGFEGIRDSAVTSVVANSTLNIPAGIQALTGYGWGINDTCYNYIDFNTKKFVQKVGRYTFTGNETITQGTILNETYRYIIVLPNCKTNVSGSVANALFSDSNYSLTTGDNIYANAANGYSINQTSFNFHDSSIQTLADFRAFIIGKTIYYELATPVETDISSYITDNDKFLEVEPLGTITFTNTYEQEVPSEITYLTEVAK